MLPTGSVFWFFLLDVEDEKDSPYAARNAAILSSSMPSCFIFKTTASAGIPTFFMLTYFDIDSSFIRFSFRLSHGLDGEATTHLLDGVTFEELASNVLGSCACIDCWNVWIMLSDKPSRDMRCKMAGNGTPTAFIFL